MKIQILGFVILAFLLLPACQSQPETELLNGSAWSLSQLNGHSLIPGTHVDIQFDRQTFSGYGGCNAYGGGYQVRINQFTIADGVESTAMACLTPEGIGEQEAEYFQALAAAGLYSVSGNQLEMRDGDGNLILVFVHQRVGARVAPEELIGGQWMVETINGSQLIDNSQITISFTGKGTVQGFGGCRSYQAEYIETDQGVRFTSIRMDEADCSHPELLQQEQDFTDYFTWADHFELVGDRLILLTQRSEQIVFVTVKD